MNSKMAGQTINDRLLAARHSLAGQGLAKSVCKATTEEMIGPKKKHLDYLVQCTNEPNVSIPQLANLLIERSQNASWVVVYKALITVHHMMCYGNERFTQYLASSNSTFQLSNFLDKSGLQGYDMSPFIRRYARYLNEKALSYRTVAFDFCKVKRGKEDGMLRTMNAEKLLKTLPSLQNQLDALLEFDCSANNLTNGVINMCFMLLFRDLIRLFACYNDGVINLLEKYFDMNKKQCRDALDLYKKFLIRMDRVAEFLKVAENVGIDKGDIPDLTKAPSSLLDALEQHLAAIEGKKSNTTTPTQNASNLRNIKSGVTALSSTSSSFGTAATNGRLETNGIDESLKQQVLAEEEAAMNQYKSKVHSPNNATNPFLNTPLLTASAAAPMDLFAPPIRETSLSRASDDLLQLNNPFADVFTQPTIPTVPLHSNMWMANGNGFAPQAVQPPTTFVSESSFSSVFGNTESTAAKDLDVCGSSLIFNPFLSLDVPIIPEPTAADIPSLLLDVSPELQEMNAQLEHTQATPVVDILSSNVDVTEDPNLTSILSPTLSPYQLPSDCESNVLSPAKSVDLFDFGADVATPSPEPLPVAKPKAVPPPRPPPPSVKQLSVRKDSIESNNALNEFDQMMLGSTQQMTPVGAASELMGMPELSFAPENQFTGFDGLGGVLQPATSHNSAVMINNTKNTHGSAQSSALLTGDLESSLASLAENLSINSRPAPVKGVQWNSPKNGAKTGTNWVPQPMAATTGAGYRPMGQGMTSLPAQPMYPQLQPMGMRPMATGPSMMTPMSAMPPASSPLTQQQSLLFH